MQPVLRNALKIGFQYGIAFLLGRLLFDLAFAGATAENGQAVLPDMVAQIVGVWNGRLQTVGQILPLASLRPLKSAQQTADRLNQAFEASPATPGDASELNTFL